MAWASFWAIFHTHLVTLFANIDKFKTGMKEGWLEMVTK
jgi:hypothetical protein